jgi:Bacterial antitoxin of type II TA system, VapB
LRSIRIRDIVTHIVEPIDIVTMKTTLDISDPLLREARKVAARERTTLRSLVEQGLRQIVAEKKRRTAFSLRKASFKGHGLRPELADAGWDRLRDLAYEGRGS